MTNLFKKFVCFVSVPFRKNVDSGTISVEPAVKSDPVVDLSQVVTGEQADEVVSTIEKTYWYSETGILHNSLCRWYEKCKGTAISETELETTEFTNCESCGGSHPIVREWNLPESDQK